MKKSSPLIPLARPALPEIGVLIPKLAEIFSTGIITEGKYVHTFEKQCQKYLEAKFVTAVSNGTSALILLLRSLNIKGEVILPSFTYSSCAHALLWCGLKPVFVDINRTTFNIDPQSIEEKITHKTTAIMPTHVFGNPCDIESIEKIARRHKLKILYDASHSFGSLYKNKPLSNFGDATIYSLAPTKVLTTGEGGLIVTNNKRLNHRLRIGKLNGDSFNRGEEFLGLTARMSEFQAIVGVENLKLFDRSLKKRMKVVEWYKQKLANSKGITFQKIEPESQSVFYNLAILIDKEKTGFSNDELINQFKKHNIQSKIYFDPPLHKKNVYKKYKYLKLPNTDYVSDHIISLPLYSSMSEKEVDQVTNVITSLIN